LCRFHAENFENYAEIEMGEELPGSIDIDKLYEDSTSKLDVKKEESPAKKPLQPFKIDYDQLWNNDADL
jgi:hypothetical protein